VGYNACFEKVCVATELKLEVGAKLGFFDKQPIAQGDALTAAKTAFTIADAEGTPDNAIAAVTNVLPFGFANAAELITLLYKVQNLHVRLGELEARLEAVGLIASN